MAPRRRRAAPVRPRVKDAVEYERRIREVMVDPMMKAMRERLRQARLTIEALARLADDLPSADTTAKAAKGLAEAFVVKQAMDNKAILQRRLSRLLGVDIRPRLNDHALRILLDEAIAQNVALIKRIPPRLHGGLVKALKAELHKAPLDEQAVTRLFQKAYKQEGWNLRRLARDQTSKTVGKLTRARNQQVGVERYDWLTQEDERVRPAHGSLHETTQRWDTPTEVGYPGDDILCRCVSASVF